MINMWRSQEAEALPLGHVMPIKSFDHGGRLGDCSEMVTWSDS